jgi:glycosyltransferase involved in cell wall biosynthesis
VITTAYGFSKAVIVTNVGSLPEIVENGVTGIIIPPADSNAIVDAVVSLMDNPQLRSRMGKEGHRKLITDLSWDSITPHILKIYTRAINSI